MVHCPQCGGGELKIIAAVLKSWSHQSLSAS